VPQEISGEYLSLLIAIQEDPFSTIEELARKTGASKPTVAKRLRELQEQKLFRVKPLLNYHNLGQEAVDVMLETDSLEKILRLEEIATKHPYTSYRARCYGWVNGLLMQFRTPIGTRPHIEELIKRLQDEGTVSNYEVLPSGSGFSERTSMKLSGWNHESMSWDFDWNKWFEITPLKALPEMEAGEPGKSLKWLTQKDTHIIYELMDGSRRKNIDIVKAIQDEGVPMTPQTFSRRYQMIRKECLAGFIVAFKPEAFDIHNNVLIVGEGNEKEISKLGARIREPSIPFESTFRSSKDKIFWFIRLQASLLSGLLSNLYSRLDKMSVYILDYNNCYFYYPWPKYLDEEHHKWMDDYDFMVTEVLKK
jgi:DNA-binding Lrp family transcriptional regulator